MSSYKWCAVPHCTNTTIKTPTKLFISVPRDLNIRKKWFQLAWRNADDMSPKTRPYFCEDHFDLQKDMKNYYQYKMGFCKKILLNNGVLPSKFHCQPDHRKRTCDTKTFRPAFAKWHRNVLIEQCVTDRLQPSQQCQPADVPLIENVENITAGKAPEKTHFENTDEVLSFARSNSPPQSDCEQNAQAILYPACNICKEDIVGLRYVCVQCSDWDMCGSCEAAGVHDHHYVLRLPRTNDVPRNHLDDLIQSIQQKLALLQTDIEIKIECLLPDEEEATLHDSEMITVKYEPQDCVVFTPPEEAIVPTAIPSSTNTPEPADSNNILITTKYFSFHVPQTKNQQTLKPTASKIVKKLKPTRSRKKNTAVCLCEDNLENSKSKVKKIKCKEEQCLMP